MALRLNLLKILYGELEIDEEKHTKDAYGNMLMRLNKHRYMPVWWN